MESLENKPSILVVDDNPLILNVVKSLLSSQDFTVDTANNGEHALTVLESKPVDVIVCDVMMPKMDGYKLHHLVRSRPELSHIPFVFLTALDSSKEIKQGTSMGADDYVTKPFDPEQLVAIIRGKVVRSNMLKDSSEARYDSYRKRVIHTLSHEFRTPLVAINTGTEMLLEQLVDNHKQLDLSKVENLLEAVYRGGQRLERLVNDFMIIQQIEAGVAKRFFDTRKEKLRISDLVTDLEESVQNELDRDGFHLKIVNMCDNAQAVVCEVQLLEILRRVMLNAMKFSINSRELEIFAYNEERTSTIEVRDRGVGIDSKKVKELLEAFGQINREKLEQQGSGLGLAIASKYAQINGCKLSFAARPDGGSIVSLSIPHC